MQMFVLLRIQLKEKSSFVYCTLICENLWSTHTFISLLSVCKWIS